jgi:MHS family proline/betaine transporter-like MFS transporter
MAQQPRKLIAIGVVANVLEWYDFSVYAFLAVIIGQLFFDVNDRQVALIKAFFVFSISYLIRPLGSIVFGYMGDTIGRRFAMRLSLIMMAIPTGIIGILPTYKDIGIAAVGLLVSLRLIQGFAAGGELPGSACYLYEASPQKHKNFFCSFVAFSSMSGVLMGSFIVWMLYAIFSTEAIYAWAWRLPFLLGFIVALIVFYIRNSVIETKVPSDNVNRINLLKQLNANRVSLFRVAMLNIFISISFYTFFVWMPSYLSVFLQISDSQAHFCGTFGLFSLIIMTMVAGYYADYIGQRKLILVSVFGVMVLSYPLFLLLETRSLSLILLVQVVMAITFGGIQGVIMAITGSLFDASVRFMGISLSFTIPTAIFGGLSPILASYLIYTTGNNLAPVILPIVASILVLPIVLYLPVVKKPNPVLILPISETRTQ